MSAAAGGTHGSGSGGESGRGRLRQQGSGAHGSCATTVHVVWTLRVGVRSRPEATAAAADTRFVPFAASRRVLRHQGSERSEHFLR
ncbi:unnamed protein product [Caenorhabditis auriculariae]|uniref:Uncharacterized protein n=1 Tax=Caenorhabditis auriculariae TaxID=2777116 RepID=A0A8S1H0Y1_9PELO|nr:unnamed protein product [Caenorhabditis auriculariae]